MKKTQMSRREFLRYSAIGAGGMMLAACAVPTAPAAPAAPGAGAAEAGGAAAAPAGE